MEKKMTSGEIARKVGISQKAIRLYDEKGLLKPVDYSEGNYRLYDMKSILVLEKIIALKQIGFTLEEIYENLILGENLDIMESLKEQLEIMEAKKRIIEKNMTCIKNVIARSNGNPDWDSVAQIAKSILKYQRADDNHYHAMAHSFIKKDWYERIYDELHLKKDKKVLDLGCGFGKVWRNNWKTIPENNNITCVDLHGSWADDFEKFICENKETLSNGSAVSIIWENVENKDVWEMIKDEKYDLVIANYLFDFIKDVDLLLKRIAGSMAKNGVLFCNGYHVNEVHMFWKKIFEELHLKSDFISKKIKEEEIVQKEFLNKLNGKFADTEIISLNNDMSYDEEEQIFEVLCNTYPENIKYFNDNRDSLEKYFSSVLLENGEFIIKNQSCFYKVKSDC